MGKNIFKNNSLEQELAEKAGKLEAQRQEREQRMIATTLGCIAEKVRTHEADILRLLADNKGSKQQAVQEVIINEVKEAAEGRLWCREYVERLRSEQHMTVYTGSHWEPVEQQLWKDFVGQCARRCGISEAMLMNPSFMRKLYEALAFNLAKYRQQLIPKDEVWLNVKNGRLVVRADGSKTLCKHNKNDLFTYTLPYSYDEHAECEQWLTFLHRVLPEPEAQRVLQEFIGYCMTPRHTLEKMLLLYGEGQNGKSVTLELTEALLGAVNVSYLSLSDLTNDEVKRAGIEGKMLNISHESGKDINANVLKQLTSGEKVLIKYLYRDPYETRNYGKFMAAFNQLPRAENTFGFFRRLIILPFSVTITEEEKDDQLTDKLKGELPGILNWVLAALPELMQRRKFTKSTCCEKALEQYRLQSDNVRLFLSEMCELSELATPASELHTAYRNYCYGSSLKPLGKNKFIARLESIGFTPVIYSKQKSFNLKINE